MFELALEEARWQAKQHEANPAKPAAADGVYCRADLSDALRDKALKAVQRVRDRRPLGLQRSALGTVDAHPGSDGLVIDLVHPSLSVLLPVFRSVLPSLQYTTHVNSLLLGQFFGRLQICVRARRESYPSWRRCPDRSTVEQLYRDSQRDR